jgi:hypothetical protein
MTAEATMTAGTAFQRERGSCPRWVPANIAPMVPVATRPAMPTRRPLVELDAPAAQPVAARPAKRA